jgi:dipeptidyl aminopeptidase/acylaminoacyl peptidase
MPINLSIIILIALFFSPFNTEAKTNNWESLYDNSLYQNAKISPDGKYLAVAFNLENKTMLVFLDRKTMVQVGAFRFGEKYEVGSYHWVNSERVVIQMVEQVPWRESPLFYGELYAVNYDGSKGKLIYGINAGESSIGSRLKKKESIRGWGSLIDVLPEDDKHILIKSVPMSTTGEGLASILLLNAYSGIIKKDYGTAPIPFARFVTDVSGNVRAVSGTDKDNTKQVYIRENNDWVKVPQGIVSNDVSIIAISASGEHLYTFDNPKQNIKGLFKLNLKDYSYKNIYTDKKVDITYAELTADGRQVFALRVDDGYPNYLIVNKKVEEAKVFKKLLAAFPFSKVNITSRSDDGEYYLASVSSDTDPGSLYLYNKPQDSIGLLFKFNPDLKGIEFFESEPFQMTASDGQIINGYFTQAKAKDNGELASLVILVHGGPHGVRDYWGFSRNTQYLALNGYSVLQVNYRGSSGYGKRFELAGHKQWGAMIQKDIFESYQWAIDNNKATAKNVCIMGGSFGAYSAIQSVTLYPNVYKCAIANAGIYDLEIMFEQGDIPMLRLGRSYLKTVLGNDSAALKKISPVNYVEKIKASLLLAHGEDDERAPVEHVNRLRSALDKIKKPYEWYMVDKEGHGFYKPANRKAYMKKVVSFLDKHLK